MNKKSNSTKLNIPAGMNFTLFCSNALQQSTNCYYPQKFCVYNGATLIEAVSHDYVCAEYASNKRSIDNFISSDCLAMDIDNDHSDNQDDWITPDKISKFFKNVMFAVHYSRNNMLPKNGKSARPKFHVLFPINKITSAEEYSSMKKKIIEIFPYFDKGAKDAARFFFGTNNPEVDFFYGAKDSFDNITIDVFLQINIDSLSNNAVLGYCNNLSNQEELETSELKENSTDKIEQGERNNKCFKYACRVAKKFINDLETGHISFLEYCKRCNPPLSEGEQATIWQQAVKYASDNKKGKTPPKYLSPALLKEELDVLGIKVEWNVFSGRLMITGIPEDSKYLPKDYEKLNNKQEIADQVLDALLNVHLKEQGYKFSREDLRDTINLIGRMNPHNPVLEMIKNVQWDRQRRVDMLCCILGIENNLNATIFLKKWLLQSLSLALYNDNGSLNADFVLVLQGKQGIGKTEFFRCITPSKLFKSGAIIDTRNKDSIIETTSYWITELGEVDATFKKEQAELKAFITNSYTEYRRPYGRSFERIPRRTSFCATVNPEQFLRDETGSRRYAVIKTNNIDCNSLHELVDNDNFRAQLWREVYEDILMKFGVQGYRLTREEIGYIEAENISATVPLPGELEICSVLDWNSPVEEWIFYTIPELIDRLDLKHITSERLGRTLTKILSSDSRVEKKKSNKCYKYKMPLRKI